ncbi:hypothetical protein [Campylobacter sp. CCS1377]|uniref:Uncharacterized protein n=1 Tax=Campylobacter sp. CCS1377 TaxID=3158229 RepID=A0AAU7EA53_9BACT|nr:hypothetical protein [Campylobacter jejuni]
MAVCQSEESDYESVASRCSGMNGDRFGACREANMKFNLWQGCLMEESIRQQQKALGGILN